VCAQRTLQDLFDYIEGNFAEMDRHSGREEAKEKLKEIQKTRTTSDVLIVPERNPHRTRTDLAVSERYLIVAKCGVQAPDKHDFFIYHIFHITARPAAPN
jgi:hypothetical protein